MCKFHLAVCCCVKDVRAHCYCASLVCTLFIRHACATSSISSMHRVETQLNIELIDLCANLVCECFCWMLGDPHFFFSRSLPFLILSIILRNKQNLYVGSFNYLSYTLYYSNSVELVHGYRCARRKSCIF